MNDKLQSFLGLCRRAGKMIFGYDQVEKSALAQKAKLILTAADFSPKSTEKLSRICLEKGIPLIKTRYTTDELYYILSYKAGVISITDDGFADKIKQLLQQENKEDFAL